MVKIWKKIVCLTEARTSDRHVNDLRVEPLRHQREKLGAICDKM